MHTGGIVVVAVRDDVCSAALLYLILLCFYRVTIFVCVFELYTFLANVTAFKLRFITPLSFLLFYF